jgi:hypothetical protein
LEDEAEQNKNRACGKRSFPNAIGERTWQEFQHYQCVCSNRKQISLDLLNKIAEYLSVNIKDLIVDK